MAQEYIFNTSLLFQTSYLHFNPAEESRARGTKWHDDFVKVSHRNVEEWSDFTEENIDVAFGRVFEHPIDFSEYFANDMKRQKDPVSVTLECDIDKAFDQFIVSRLKYSLSRLTEILRGHQVKLHWSSNPEVPRVEIPMARGDQKKSGLKRPNYPVYAWKPRGFTGWSKTVYTIGNCARDHVFDHIWLRDGDDYESNFANVQLGKLGMYLLHSQTCLGWITTPFGVTVLRYFFVDGTSKVGVQHKTFSWRKLGSARTMRPIKAIFAVIMMSLLPDDRAFQSRSQLKSLADWTPL